MRFHKGSKVEVLQDAEVPLGSWRSAEIISGNGHNYYVRYDPCPIDYGEAVGRVPTKAIRPRPPAQENLVYWAPGDILEVFDSYSWKVAGIVRVLGVHHYLVRLLGSSQELRVHVSNLRLRQLWQDGGWVVIPKDSARCPGGSFRSQSKGGKFGFEVAQSHQQLYAAAENHLLKNKIVVEGDVSRSMKRKSSAVSTYPAHCSEVTKRVQLSHRDGRYLPTAPGDPLHLMEKVDAVDSPCLMLGEKYTHASLNKRTNGFRKMNLAGANTNLDYQYCGVTSPDTGDADSMASSVGSCSPSISPYRSQYYPLADDSEDVCSRTGDAEASVSGREISVPVKDVLRDKTPSLLVKDVLRDETHLLELHAYRATMMALYASGSISWEQEALMTNLRLTLNISTDEHLAELRNLASSSVHSR